MIDWLPAFQAAKQNVERLYMTYVANTVHDYEEVIDGIAKGLEHLLGRLGAIQMPPTGPLLAPLSAFFSVKDADKILLEAGRHFPPEIMKAAQKASLYYVSPLDHGSDHAKRTEASNRDLAKSVGQDEAEWIIALSRSPLQAAHHPMARVIIGETISVALQNRFEHMHVVGGTGHGKTQLLQRLILSDMETDACVVVIDSQGQMLDKILRAKLSGDVVYIDPADIDHPPALNMFDVSRLDGLPQAKREQFLNGLIELLEYVFAGLLKAELTQKQNVLFRYSLRLMLAVPDATLLDLVKFLSNPDPYLTHAGKLPMTVQEFFKSEFKGTSYNQTREQIRRRLYGVLENDAFRRMFSSKRNKLNLVEKMKEGSLILVDTAKSHLKAEASALLGRYFIALTLQAAMEREDSKPAYLYIDEAGEYFDDNIDTLLNEARKRSLGLIMAHQYLGQLTPQLRASIATNTATKMAGGVSEADARALSGDMRCEPRLIMSQPQLSFACYMKGRPHAFSTAVAYGVLESAPQLTPEQYDKVRQDIRLELSEASDPEPADSDETDNDRPAPVQAAEILPSKEW